MAQARCDQPTEQQWQNRSKFGRRTDESSRLTFLESTFIHIVVHFVLEH